MNSNSFPWDIVPGHWNSAKYWKLEGVISAAPTTLSDTFHNCSRKLFSMVNKKTHFHVPKTIRVKLVKISRPLIIKYCSWSSTILRKVLCEQFVQNELISSTVSNCYERFVISNWTLVGIMFSTIHTPSSVPSKRENARHVEAGDIFQRYKVQFWHSCHRQKRFYRCLLVSMITLRRATSKKINLLRELWHLLFCFQFIRDMYFHSWSTTHSFSVHSMLVSLIG